MRCAEKLTSQVDWWACSVHVVKMFRVICVHTVDVPYVYAVPMRIAL